MHQRITLLVFALLSTSLALAGTQSREDLSSIDFPDTSPPRSEPYFLGGVLLLHSVAYEDAHQEFLKAQQADSDFALNYWGEVVTHNPPLWHQQDKEKPRAALWTPGIELLGDVRLAMGQSQKTQLEYAESLLRNPGISLSLLGLALSSKPAGDPLTLALSVNSLKKNWENGDMALPILPETQSDGMRRNSSDEKGPQPAKLGTISSFASDSDRFFFGGQPSLDDLAKLKELGARTIINLRSHQEMDQLDFDEEAAAREAGFRYVHFPVTATDPNQENLQGLFDILQDPASQPLFLHCRTSNRSGFIWALFKGLRGAQSETNALRQGEQAGLRSASLKEKTRRLLSRAQKEKNP